MKRLALLLIVVILGTVIIYARSTQAADTDQERFPQGYHGTVTYGDNGPIAAQCSVRLCYVPNVYVKYDESDDEGYYEIDLSIYRDAPDGMYHLVAWEKDKWKILYWVEVRPHGGGGIWTKDMPMEQQE
ncbi:MAG: hypothetical protein WBB37_11905 [bacterium]